MISDKNLNFSFQLISCECLNLLKMPQWNKNQVVGIFRNKMYSTTYKNTPSDKERGKSSNYILERGPGTKKVQNSIHSHLNLVD